MLNSILVWYIAMQFLAIIGLPVAFATLKHLPSRGYGTAKALGVLLTGVVFWWGSILHLWENTTGAVLTSAAIVLAAGLFLVRRQWRDANLGDTLGVWWHHHKRHVIVVEGLFLIAFIVWALVRASQPQLQTAGGEKWMEIAFLNAFLRSPNMPPQDPWLSGFSISYYYLGYLLVGIITRLTALPPTVAFNLGNAGWFALIAVQAYSLVYNMSRGRGATRSLLAPLLLLVAGNGEGFLEVLHARGLLPTQFWTWMDIGRLVEPAHPPFSWVPQRFFWWWQASRTLRDRTPWGDVQEVIDEFPAFSFTLGDMHPHLLALPFVLVAVTLALNSYLLAVQTGTDASSTDTIEARTDPTITEKLLRFWMRLQPRLAPLAGAALILGALGFLNTWDFPIYWAVLVGAWVLGRYRQREKSFESFFTTVWQLIPEAGVLGVLSIVLYLPFWFALRSQAGGILPNLFNATKLQQFIVMFLPLLVPVGGLILRAGHRRSLRWQSAVGLGIGLMVGIALVGLIIGSAAAAPYLTAIVKGESIQGYSMAPETAWAAIRGRLLNPWTGLLLASGVGISLTAVIQPPKAIRKRRETQRNAASSTVDDTFPLLLALVGLLLTLAPEFVYLKDVFVTRMNTIFKFYFQAWVLWSLAGAWQLSQWLDRGNRPKHASTPSRLAAALSILLIAVGLVYTVLAVPARAKEQGVPWTLDGAAWLRDIHAEDAAAIAWLNANVQGAPVIVEAPGDQHRAYIYEGRVSALTGLPSILGWGGHQLQWRGTYDEPAVREADINLLMTTVDQSETVRILDHYNAAYVYIGPLERQRYPADALAKFGELYPAIYDQDGVAIYEITAKQR